MLVSILIAILVAVIVYLVCKFVGGVILKSLGVPIAVQSGAFLEAYAGVIAAVAGLWYFFKGGLPF